MDVVQQTQTVDRIARALPMVHGRLGLLCAGLEESRGLTQVQLQLLDFIFRNGPSTIKRLKEGLGRAQSSVSELVDRLCEKSLLERSRGKDRRKTLVQLSAAGRRWMLARQLHQRKALMLQLETLDSESRRRMLDHMGALLSLTERIRLEQRKNSRKGGNPSLQ